MKKMFLLSILLVVTCIANAQLSEQNKKLLTKNNVLYLRDNGHDFRVDTRTVTVKLKEGETLNKNNLTIQRQNKLGYIDITVPEGMDVEKFAKELDESGIYEIVELNSFGTYHSLTVNDSYTSNQWYLDRINARDAWTLTMGIPYTKAAIIDSGIEWTHPDIGMGSDNYSNLTTNLCWDYTTNDSLSLPTNLHGTVIAGIIGAKTNNSIGVSGISGGNHQRGISMFSCGLGSNFAGSFLDDAIIDATDKGAKIIQISLGAAYSQAIDDAIEYAYANGVTIVCSAGNTPISLLAFPASHSKTIAVGASAENNKRANFSSFGTGLDIVAPGTNIWSTVLNGGYNNKDSNNNILQGTSFSAPQVSGVVALMLSRNPFQTPAQIRTILRNTAIKLSSYSYINGWNEEVGYGLLNAYAAVNSTTPLIINGTDVICDSAIFCINNLPDSIEVAWELGNEYYNDSEDLFKTDYPTSNQCMIVRDNLLTLNDTLTARIYDEEGTLIKTLKHKVRTRTKAEFPISVEDNSWPPVLSSASVAEDDPAKVPSGALVKMGSSRFNGMNITSSGACTYLLHSGDSVKLRTTGIASLQCINNSNCDQFTLYFYTKKKPLIPLDPPIIDDSLIIEPLVLDEPKIVGGRGLISVTLNQVIENVDDKDDLQTIPLSNDVPWNISIYRYTDGKRVHDKKVQGSHIQVNTNGWDSGLYIVRIVCGNQIFSCKINL